MQVFLSISFATERCIPIMPGTNSLQFSSVAQSCPTLCDPMNLSTPGLPVYHQLLEFTQTHVHWVGDAIQPSHPLSSHHLILCHPLLLLPASRSFQMSQFFTSCGQSIGPVLPTNIQDFSTSSSDEYSAVISFRIDWLDLLAVQGSQKSSPTPQFKSINSSMLSFPYGPTLISIHDYWKNHSFD